MSGIPNVSTRVTPKRIALKETGSCFDTTIVAKKNRTPTHIQTEGNQKLESAFSMSKSTAKVTTDKFLHKSEGYGGLSETEKNRKYKELHPATPPPPRKQAPAYRERTNLPNTTFRKFYERGDLPVQVDHGVKNMVAWKVDITKLDFHHYLPIFFDGLREIEEPYAFLAEQGIKDMVANATMKVLPVIPQLIIPIKEALNTRNKIIIMKVLHILQLIAACDSTIPLEAGGKLIGKALVPYYRQLLPVLNIFIRDNENLGDVIDYGQRKHQKLGDLIQQTLETLETNGGEDAFINIKYLIPTYQSVMLG